MELLKNYTTEIEQVQKNTVAAMNQALVEIFTSIKDKGPIKGFDWSYATGIIFIEMQYNQKKYEKIPEKGSLVLGDILAFVKDGDLQLSYYDSDDKENFYNITFEESALKGIEQVIEVFKGMMEAFGGPYDSHLETLLRNELKFSQKPLKPKKEHKKF